jgi:DNA-directed RNA polymerase subunit H (RpoH/RPB5)
MDSELLDLIARTRPTILEILKNRGYSTEPHEQIAPEELVKLATTNTALLNLTVTKTEGSIASVEECGVLYWVDGATRHRVEGILQKMFEVEDNPTPVDPAKKELVIVLSEPFHEVFHLQAVKFWNKIKARISFLPIKNLVSNPAHHSIVPPHRKMTTQEITEIMQKHHIRSKSEFPRILYHVDMQARVLGLVPGDIVEIRRSSPTAGEYVLYRVCTLS